MEHECSTSAATSDLEFIRTLRECVASYLHSVDAWEAQYQKVYRLARPNQRVTPDLEDAQTGYLAARRGLESRIPRARRLSVKFDVRNLWPGLLRIELGAHAPQSRSGSAFGRSERIAINDALTQLELRCADWEAKPQGIIRESPATAPRTNLLQKILDYLSEVSGFRRRGSRSKIFSTGDQYVHSTG